MQYQDKSGTLTLSKRIKIPIPAQTPQPQVGAKEPSLPHHPQQVLSSDTARQSSRLLAGGFLKPTEIHQGIFCSREDGVGGRRIGRPWLSGQQLYKVSAEMGWNNGFVIDFWGEKGVDIASVDDA